MPLKSGAIRELTKQEQVKANYIDSDSPWENGYIERFHYTLRDELLNWEVFG